MGRIRDRQLAELAERYIARAARLAPVRVVEVRGSKATEFRRRSREDAAALRSAVADRECVLLTPRGEPWSSEDLARYLRARLDRSAVGTAFAVGGEEGLVPEDERWAAHRLQLTAMTLPHELARLVLAEQVYRALTILRNVKYHK